MAEIDTALRQNDDFLKTAYLKALFPCMLSILSGNINILVDGIIVGQKLGVNGLAALNLCLPVYLTLCVVGSFLVSGAAIATSGAIGRNERAQGQRYYHLSIGLCLTASIVIMAAGLFFLDEITSILCRDELLRPMVRTYTGVTLWGTAPKIILYVPVWYLRMDGRNREVTIVMSVMAGVNIVQDYIFLFGFDMGIFGAALASVLATLAAALLGFLYLSDRKSGFYFGIRFFPSRKEWPAIIKNGSPAAMNNLMQTLRILAVNAVLGAYGNTIYIAMFAPINCVSEFSLCLIQGVPQAAVAMLGIYCGERDNGSARILMRLQWKYGKLYTLLFGAVAVGSAGLVAMVYGLEVSLCFAMICLSVSIFPALVIGIFSGYYNVSEHTGWANMLICFRVFVFPAASLFLLYKCSLSPWPFMILGESATLILWFFCIWIYHGKHPKTSKYLLMDDRLTQERKILDFSIEGTVEAICDGCVKISDFCEENGMSVKQVMRMSLSMEELMTMILKENRDQTVAFDLRLLAIQDSKGIRIRYSGEEYNPFRNRQKLDDVEYLGVRMIYDMVECVTYQRTFGMNMLQILI